MSRTRVKRMALSKCSLWLTVARCWRSFGYHLSLSTLSARYWAMAWLQLTDGTAFGRKLRAEMINNKCQVDEFIFFFIPYLSKRTKSPSSITGTVCSGLS